MVAGKGSGGHWIRASPGFRVREGAGAQAGRDAAIKGQRKTLKAVFIRRFDAD